MKLRDKLLMHFTANPGVVYSGEALAEEFDVTRAAVWKAMKLLKEEGYRIDTVLGKGYCFSVQNEPLNAEVICNCAGKKMPLYLLDTVDSTNNYAKRLIIDGCKDGTYIIADHQTSGRGRKGHTFYSPSSTGLYISYIDRHEHEMTGLYRMTIAAAVAVVEAVRMCTKDDVKIKWFNDLYLGTQKAGGILCEATSDVETLMTDAVIIGIGINCHTITFPAELMDKAVSLQDPDSSRNQLAGYLYHRLQYWLKKMNSRELMDAYRSCSCILHHHVIYDIHGETKRGYVQDITDEGRIVIIDEEHKEHTYTSREISLQSWD